MSTQVYDNRAENNLKEAEAGKIAAELRRAAYNVAGVEKKEKRRYSSPPFITSSLQIEANRKLRFSAKKIWG